MRVRVVIARVLSYRGQEGILHVLDAGEELMSVYFLHSSNTTHLLQLNTMTLIALVNV